MFPLQDTTSDDLYKFACSDYWAADFENAQDHIELANSKNAVSNAKDGDGVRGTVASSKFDRKTARSRVKESRQKKRDAKKCGNQALRKVNKILKKHFKTTNSDLKIEQCPDLVYFAKSEDDEGEHSVDVTVNATVFSTDFDTDVGDGEPQDWLFDHLQMQNATVWEEINDQKLMNRAQDICKDFYEAEQTVFSQKEAFDKARQDLTDQCGSDKDCRKSNNGAVKTARKSLTVAKKKLTKASKAARRDLKRDPALKRADFKTPYFKFCPAVDDDTCSQAVRLVEDFVWDNNTFETDELRMLQFIACQVL